MARKSEIYLPVSTKPQPKFRVKALLGHCLYRRVVIWTVVIIILLSFTLFNPRITARSRDVFDLVHGSKTETKSIPQLHDNIGLQKQDGKEDRIQDLVEEEKAENELKEQEEKEGEREKEKGKEDSSKGPHWLKYKQ